MRHLPSKFYCSFVCLGASGYEKGRSIVPVAETLQSRRQAFVWVIVPAHTVRVNYASHLIVHCRENSGMRMSYIDRDRTR